MCRVYCIGELHKPGDCHVYRSLIEVNRAAVFECTGKGCWSAHFLCKMCGTGQGYFSKVSWNRKEGKYFTGWAALRRGGVLVT